MTQDEYNRIRRMVFARIPREWCDREDALQYGMLAACESYRGLHGAQASTFIVTCAFYYASKQYHRKSGRYSVPFTDLQQPEQDYDDLVAYLARTEDDHSNLEGLDPVFLECIRESLKNKSDWFMRKGKVGKSPTRTERAIRILDVLARSVEQDSGIGVDEYEGRPTHPRDNRRGFANERSRVRQRLMQHFGLPYQKYDEALLGLRKATDQVIREGGT
jgi:hypothetical protein